MRRSATLWVQLVFLAVFVVTAVWVALLRPPAERPAPPRAAGGDARARCEARGDWWDEQDGVCAVPMPITTLTHRPAPH
jgi:hypothetical protein